MATEKKMPAMPSLNLAKGEESKRGGLGRGLASLIPTGAEKPRLGNGAADIILGGGSQGKVTPGSNEEGTASQAGAKQSGPAKSKAGAKKSSTAAPSKSKRSPAAGTSTKTGAAAAAQTSTTKRHSDKTHEGANHTNPFGATYAELPLNEIRPNAKQPRTVFAEEALQELIHSIREFGVMQPIVVRPTPGAETPYELIMGERRFRASQAAKLTHIPAIIRLTEDGDMLRDALLENIHRAQLNPLEEAAAYQQLLEEFNVTQAQLADRIGRSRPLITNMIRLLSLPVDVQRRVAAGVLSSGHARALLSLNDDTAAQAQLAERIVREGLSVRATEEAVTLIKRETGTAKPRKSKSKTTVPPEVSDWANTFGDALDTKVTVQWSPKRGKIVLEFGGKEDFERIIELLNIRNNQGD